MKVAKPLGGVVVLEHQCLPDGVNVLIVPCAGYESDGKVYGYTGWNSDRNVAYYRNDAMIALSKSVNAYDA